MARMFANSGGLCVALRSMLGFIALGLPAGLMASGKALADKPRQKPQRIDGQQDTAASDGAKKPFHPENFTLSDLVENLDSGNYFKMPAESHDFLRKILASGVDFSFKPHSKKGIYAYISSDLSPNIWINLSSPPERLAEAICHELLHYQDFKTDFKPITSLKHSGFAPGQSKVFHGQIRELINMISHEYVKKGLERFGFKKPLAAAMDNRMRILTTQVESLERAFVPISKKLAATPDRKTRLTIGNLQVLYRGLMLNVLRDRLLFNGAYTKRLDLLMKRFQAVLDFMLESTSEDPRFKKVYRKLIERADAIRIACRKYHDSSKSATERYALLTGTLDQVYKKVGISFGLIPRGSKAPVLKATSVLLQPGESFLLDGQFLFSHVKVFTPYSPPRQPRDDAESGQGSRDIRGKSFWRSICRVMKPALAA